MNEDVIAGQWRELRGTLKSWWGNLSDDDFDWVAGEKDRLIGVLQQKYGWTRDQAQEEVSRRFSEYGNKDLGKSLGDIKAKTYALGEQAANKARGAVSAATDGLEAATSYIKGNDLSAMTADLREIIRKYPFYALLIGAGVIYLLSRSTRR
jgi:uncharacterized protein YjbJ (UPF0337 family)